MAKTNISPINNKQLLKVYVVFNGITGAILDSFGVSSVVKNAIGDYTINFSVPFLNTNYTIVDSNGFTTGVGPAYAQAVSQVSAPIVNLSSYRFGTGTSHANGAAMVNRDMDIVRIAFFGDQ